MNTQLLADVILGIQLLLCVIIIYLSIKSYIALIKQNKEYKNIINSNNALNFNEIKYYKKKVIINYILISIVTLALVLALSVLLPSFYIMMIIAKIIK